MKGVANNWVVNWLAGVSLLVASVASAADVTDNDRMFRSYTRETATVPQGQLRLEVQGMDLQSEGNSHVNIIGLPVTNVDSISGGVIDLVASYGLAKNTEVGLVIPGLIESERFKVPVQCVGGPKNGAACTTNADCGTGGVCTLVTPGSSQTNSDVGDLLLYVKFKHQVAEHCWMGGGVEVTTPNSSEGKGFTTGDFSFNPVASTRYQRGPFAVGAHAGAQIYNGETPNAFNYSIEGLVRPAETYALRTEWAGRIYSQGGTRIWDAQVLPGIDVNLANNLIVRPEGMIKGSTDSWDWGIGVGLATTF